VTSPAPTGTEAQIGRRVSGIPGSSVLLTAYIALLFLVPSRLVVGPLGAIGAPAALMGLVLLGWWLVAVVTRQRRQVIVVNPVRRAAVLLLAAVLASSVMAMVRPIKASEASANQIGIILMFSWMGVLLLAHDGVAGRADIDRVLRRLAVLGAVTALVGILQFATGRAFTDLIQIPGLVPNVTLVSVFDRSGFSRPSGTAIHPIEFGTTMVLLLPVAVYSALHPPRDLGGLRRWWPTILISIAIPLSLSRSAFVGLVVVLAFLLPSFDRRRRAVALVSMLGGAMALFVLVPGFLGTVTKLFTGAGSDTSVLSRSDSYDLALEFAARSPVFGRGFLTFLPEYRILDNQYLGMLIDTGVFGLLALLGLFVVAIWTALALRRTSATEPDRALGVSCAASVAAAGLSFAFFDALSFPQMTGSTFLVIGIVGAGWRLREVPGTAGAGRASTHEAITSSSDGRPGRESPGAPARSAGGSRP